VIGQQMIEKWSAHSPDGQAPPNPLANLRKPRRIESRSRCHAHPGVRAEKV
jgi:hypothetical protein